MKKIQSNHLKKILLFLVFIATGVLTSFGVDSCENEQEIIIDEDAKASFKVVGEDIYMNGFIVPETYDKFVEVLEKNPQVKNLVLERVPGSLDDDTMIKLAYFVREKALNTKILSYSSIASGGVDLFLAGVEREMERGAFVGVHSWRNGDIEAKDLPKDDAMHESYTTYNKEMLGDDSFYWFTIYAAPAWGMHQMSVAEIEKYKLLTKPIRNVKMSSKIPGVIGNIFENTFYGNLSSKTVVINLQGGPTTTYEYERTLELFTVEAKIDLSNTAFIHPHQVQTLMPWKFMEKEITFDKAKSYGVDTTKRLFELIQFFKSNGIKVYLVGISYGAFLAQDLIATYGNIADKYLIVVGRLDINQEIWKEFSKGKYVVFEYDDGGNSKIIDLELDKAGAEEGSAILEKNMAKLAAGYGYKRYTKLLKNEDLSNVVYVYGKRDEQVGALSKSEIDFLKSKNATIIESEFSHMDTIYHFLQKGLVELGVTVIE